MYTFSLQLKMFFPTRRSLYQYRREGSVHIPCRFTKTTRSAIIGNIILNNFQPIQSSGGEGKDPKAKEKPRNMTKKGMSMK
jgi:hypothetical protein